MSTLDKAARVIDQWTQEGYELNHAVGSPHAIAERLADAGLLAPALPEPASSGWVVETPLVGKVALGVGAKVALLPQGTKFQETHITPTAARELAYALLAAANYSEGNE